MAQLQEISSNGTSLRCLSPSSHAHALLLPYPAQGHINPFMQLGKLLAAHGIRVTIATVEHVHAKVVRAHERSHSLISDDFQLLGIKDGLPPDFDREAWGEEMKTVVDKTLEGGALELVHTLASQGRPITCIVGDFFLRWTVSLAQTAAVPEFIFWPQCASVLSIYMHVDAIISSGYDPFEGNVRASVSREAPMKPIACIPGLPMGIHPADLPFECPLGKIGLEWIQEVLRARLSRMGESHGVIGNSFDALEPDVLKALTLRAEHHGNWPRSIRLVGPLVPMAVVGEAKTDVMSGASFWQEEVEECRQWLDSQPASSVLFVAFGSITPITVPQLQELAFGLASSGQRFLWVIRENAIIAAGITHDFITKVDYIPLDEALPQGFLELNHHVCKVVRWAPQAMVLSHPSVGGFFSHCGWNSTLESMCYGVPLLGWPWLMDQATNCWLASHMWNVGLTLQRNEENETSREHVERGVRQLMEGPLSNSLRARARELKDLAHEALLRNDHVLSFVEDIRNCTGAKACIGGPKIGVSDSPLVALQNTHLHV